MHVTDDTVTCFVIGPIGDRTAAHGSEGRNRYERAIQTWEEIIEPACAEFGIEPIRADRIAQPGEITDQIFRHLRDDELVIADLTDANPNVMYELGLRHTVDRLTIQVGENGRLPFDIGSIRTILFPRTELGLIEARDRLIDAIRAGLGQGHDRVTATRIWHERDSSTDLLSQLAQAPDGVVDSEPGFLDVLAAAEEAYPKISNDLTGVANVITELNKLVVGVTVDIQASDQRGGGAGGRLLIASQFAKSMAPLIEQIDELSGAYVDDMKVVVPAINYLLDRIETEPELANETEVQELLQSTAGLGPQMQTMVATISQFATTIDGIGKITRLLREPAQRLSRAVRRLAEFQSVADTWSDRSHRMLRHTD